MVIAALSTLPSREPRPPASTRAVHPGVGEAEVMLCSLACHRVSPGAGTAATGSIAGSGELRIGSRGRAAGVLPADCSAGTNRQHERTTDDRRPAQQAPAPSVSGCD